MSDTLGSPVLPGPAAGAGSTPAAQAAAGTGTNPRPATGAPPRSRAARAAGSSYQIVSGARRVKGYPITRDELFTLGGVGALTSIFLGFGASFVERSYDLQANLELSSGVAPLIVARWETREWDYWYIGLVLLALGTIIAVIGGAKIWSVVRSTEHPE